MAIPVFQQRTAVDYTCVHAAIYTAGVGKTSIMIRWDSKKFTGNTITTTGSVAVGEFPGDFGVRCKPRSRTSILWSRFLIETPIKMLAGLISEQRNFLSIGGG